MEVRLLLARVGCVWLAIIVRLGPWLTFCAELLVLSRPVRTRKLLLLLGLVVRAAAAVQLLGLRLCMGRRGRPPEDLVKRFSA